MGLMGFVGQFMLGIVIFKMGGVYDVWGAAAAFSFVAKLTLIPFVIFAAWWIKDYMSGGYKAVKLSELPAEQFPEGGISEVSRRS